MMCGPAALKKKIKHFISFAIPYFFAASSLQACGDAGTPVTLTAYNHSHTHDIDYFSLNGSGGVDVRQGSVSGERCCVVIPNVWRPGLKATVTWRYVPVDGEAIESTAVITQEVELPKYPHPDSIRVHFFENNKVKIVVSKCSPKHPFYPLSAEERLPWKPMSSKEEYRNSGGPIDC